MPDYTSIKVFWSTNALENAAEIKQYLYKNFGNKEVQSFYEFLRSFEEAIAIFPHLFPSTNKKAGIRRAVLIKELSAFYRESNSNIEIIALFDNRCDLNEWL